MLGVHELAIYLLGAMNTFTPQSDHRYYEKRDVTQARYEQFAEDLATVALDPRTKSLFKGPDGRIKTALLLAVMASYESSYKDDVMSCTKLGDQGTAFGPFQSHEFSDTVCQGTFQAAWIAIEMIHESFQICHNLPQSFALSEYTDGNGWRTERAHKRSSDRIDTALHYYRAHVIHLN